MRKTLFFILLLEGFITISIEILAIRQLMPFYGGSIIITSMVIGTFLLFLAIGYWRGGLHREQFFRRISINFSLSLLWLGFGLSYLFIAWYFTVSLKFSIPFLLSLTLYLLAVVSPIVFWLGQTIPLTTNLFSKELRVSHISGQALFISTLGSFLGAILTSLLLFHFLGVAWTVFINSLLLFLLMIYLQPHSKLSLLYLLGLALTLVFIFELNVNFERTHFSLTNNYANYKIITPPDLSKILQINHSNSSKIDKDNTAFAYIEYLREILFKQLQLHDKQFLVIGAGGFTFTAKGTNHNEVTYVDIDPDIKPLAEKQFLEKPINGKFIGQDARQFLQQNSQRYDIIISDVYSHITTIPPGLLTIEYFQLVARHLKPNGLFVANIITNPLFKTTYSQRIHQTLTEVFPFCNVIPLSWSAKTTNVLYICNATQQRESRYTDNLNQATIDFFHELENTWIF